jgi:hypothetical protein
MCERENIMQFDVALLENLVLLSQTHMHVFIQLTSLTAHSHSCVQNHSKHLYMHAFATSYQVHVKKTDEN